MYNIHVILNGGINLRSFAVILFYSTVVLAGPWVASIELPYGYVTGIGTGEDMVWAIDSITMSIYGFDSDYPYSLLETLSVEGASSPVGLAWADGSLYYAQSGTAILHAMTTEGDYLGYWDFSAYGIQEISGVAWNHDDMYTTPCFLLADPASHKIWSVWPPGEFTEVYSVIDLPEDLVFHDIGCGGQAGDYATWLACESPDPHYRMQLWNPSGLANHIYSDPPGQVSGAAQHESEPEFFVWLSVPSALSIYLYYYGLGIGDISSQQPATDLVISENPVIELVVISGTGFGENARISIYDLTGRELLHTPFEGSFAWSGCNREGSPLSPGCYIVRVSGDNGKVSSARLVLVE